jgi:hypothetical protein
MIMKYLDERSDSVLQDNDDIESHLLDNIYDNKYLEINM